MDENKFVVDGIMPKRFQAAFGCERVGGGCAPYENGVVHIRTWLWAGFSYHESNHKFSLPARG